MPKSIAIVQTSAVSSAELAALCAELMPGVQVHQIIDDSLIREVNANGGPTRAVKRRLYEYYQAAQSLGVAAILNQCSSVGEVADEIRPFIDVPIVKVDEAMARRAVELGPKIGVVATVESTVRPSVRQIERMAKEAGREISIDLHLAAGAMVELIEHKNAEKHNAMVLGDIETAAKANDVVVLAQGSMTVMLPLLGHITTPVLTSPRLGVEHLKSVVERGTA